MKKDESKNIKPIENSIKELRIPQSLKQNGRFCNWRFETSAGRAIKVPYSPISGERARTNDPETFGSFEEAVDALNNPKNEYSGIGVGIFGDLVGVDIDHCIDDEGKLSPLAETVISLLESYTEISPSGTGIHILCYAPGLKYDSNQYYIKNSRLGIEIYPAGITNRYLTLTGEAMKNSEINDCTEKIKEVMETYMVRGTAYADGVDSTSEETVGDEVFLLNDTEVIDAMLRSKKAEKIARLLAGDIAEYESSSEADLALCNYLAYFTAGDFEQTDRIFRESGLMRDKWDQRRGALTYGEMTINKAIMGLKSNSRQRTVIDETKGVCDALKFLTERNIIDNPRYQRNDIGAGYLLADYLKSFARPAQKGKTWMVYDGVRWSDNNGESVVEEAARCLGRALIKYASELPETETKAYLDWAGKWSQRNKRRTYIQEASTVHTVSRGDFDSDTWLLNVNNGTLDLRTMQLKPHNPDDLITHLAPVDYNPEARCERWEQFIDEIMKPCDLGMETVEANRIVKEKARFMQRFFGCCLCGDTREEKFAVLYGPTSRNGKTVAVETIQNILGTYGKTVNADTLMITNARNGSGPSEDIARLAGIRFASVAEIPQGAKLDAAKVKQLTGGDSVTARFLGENSFEFVPQFKLAIHTNHLPQCSDMSVFESGRVMVIPFQRHFEPSEQDHGLKTLFRTPENMSGILNWLLAGLSEYKRIGFAPPEAILSATKEYRKDSNKVCRFIEESLECDPEGEVRTASLYYDYKTWCYDNGLHPESNRNFIKGLEREGLTVVKARPKGGGGATTLLKGYRICAEDELNTA